jgi:hypothetical protein
MINLDNLALVSFVGVDIHTNRDDILNFKAQRVPCEWGVLFSDSKSQTKHVRYPDYKFCKEFLEWCDSVPRMGSLHLCGDVIDRYLKQEDDVMELCSKAMRIQLNLNINNYPDHDKLAEDILSVIANHEHRVILQQNKTKEKFMKVFLEKAKTKISLLHDGSGGFGRVITQIDPPHDFHVTGYAGGIKPDNVKGIVELIEKNNPNNRPYYIDMESGVRENNIFSIEKCQQVIDNLVQD